jgi:small-conductance mechanosensitive channel
MPDAPQSRGQPEQEEKDVQRALREAGAAPRPPPARVKAAHKLALGSYLVVLVVLGALYYALGLSVFGLDRSVAALAQRLTRAAMVVALILGVAKGIDVFLLCRLEDEVSRYNLRRVLGLSKWLLVALLVVSVIFRNWYAAFVSLGLISAIVGFALQTPISSFIGWIYILVKQPYRVGDRIQIGDATGDVIAVGYLDTTLWEFGGPYVSTDHPSGRVIKFPNANVLSTAVYNYSWPLFPYIWNEIDVQIAYGSDFEFVASTMRRVVEEMIGEGMVERIRTFRGLLAKTPVDELEVKDHPVVLFRVSENTWVEAIVRYLVQPKRAGGVKSTLTERILKALNEQPDRVQFPKGPNR